MTNATSSWFEVDREGLGLQTERRHPAFVIYELFQNSADENATEINVELSALPERGVAALGCSDNAAGFEDIADAYTFFKPSKKRSNAALRGRFNTGEKIVLSRCKHAEILTTIGTVFFDADGTRRINTRRKLPVGTTFGAVIRMTNAEVEAALEMAHRILVPDGVKFSLNGEPIERREPIRVLNAPGLQTEVDFRPTRRNTTIELHRPPAGQPPMIFEMGVPVVEHDGAYDINVQQRVPLNSDRDNVTPAYLKSLYTVVLEGTADLVDQDIANSTWVKTALPNVTPEAARKVLVERFGEKTVIGDPSDWEATKRLQEKGYTVLSGRSLSNDEWDVVRRAEVFKPAGQVLPSGIKMSPDGKPPIPESEWTPGMHRVATYAKAVAWNLCRMQPNVTIYKGAGLGWAGCWGHGTLSFNASVLGQKWFDHPDQEAVDALIIHELAHYEGGSDHFTDRFVRACCSLGARLRPVEVTM